MWRFYIPILHFGIAYAATYNVDVGRTGLNFNPSALYNVDVGDIVNFHFYPSNHSIAESSFDQPCRPKPVNGDDKPIYSGFISVQDGVASQMWSVKINKTDPIWLYDSQSEHQHCRNGQSMVINPINNVDQTLDKYMEAALIANVSSPDDTFGGVLVNDDGGQSVQGPMARPLQSLKPSMTGTATGAVTGSTKPKSGVAPIRVNLVWELSAWVTLALIFFVTLE